LEAKKKNKEEKIVPLRQQLDGNANTLRNNPLQNFSKPNNTNNAPPSSSNPKEKSGYLPSLIYVDGEEFSFEEVRAARFAYFEDEFMAVENTQEKRTLQPIKDIPEEMVVEKVEEKLAFQSSNKLQDELERYQVPIGKPPHPPSASLPPEAPRASRPPLQPISKSQDQRIPSNAAPSPAATSYTSRLPTTPTMTINTRQAMQEVMAAFQQANILF
jgi:hypothetical protein